MKVIIRIDCDTAAFSPEPEKEISRILRRLAGEVADSLYDKSLCDIDQNYVGSIVVMDANPPE